MALGSSLFALSSFYIDSICKPPPHALFVAGFVDELGDFLDVIDSANGKLRVAAVAGGDADRAHAHQALQERLLEDHVVHVDGLDPVGHVPQDARLVEETSGGEAVLHAQLASGQGDYLVEPDEQQEHERDLPSGGAPSGGNCPNEHDDRHQPAEHPGPDHRLAGVAAPPEFAFRLLGVSVGHGSPESFGGRSHWPAEVGRGLVVRWVDIHTARSREDAAGGVQPGSALVTVDGLLEHLGTALGTSHRTVPSALVAGC